MDRRILAVLIVLLLAAVAILASYVALQRGPGWSVTKYLDDYNVASADGLFLPTTLESFDEGSVVVLRDKIVAMSYDLDENVTTFSFLYEGSKWLNPNQQFPRAPDLSTNLWIVTISGNWADDYDNGDMVTLVGLVHQDENYPFAGNFYTIEYVSEWGVQA